MRRNIRRALFGGAIDIDGDLLPVPVKLLGNICIVVNIHRQPLAFMQSQQGSGKLPVIGGGGDKAVIAHLNQPIANLQGVVGFLRCGLWRCRAFLGPKVEVRQQNAANGCCCNFHKFTTTQR